MRNVYKYLDQAFPKAENKLRTIVSVSVFIPCFLLVFKPFGIHLTSNDYRDYLFILGYGLVTLLVLLVTLVVIEKLFIDFFSEKKWKVWKELSWLLFVIMTIGVGNLFYSSFFLGWSTLSFDNVIAFQFRTLAVAFFPISIFVIVQQEYLLKRYRNSAKEVNEAIEECNVLLDESIVFSPDNVKGSIDFRLDDFYYIESKGNYIEIALMVEGEMCKTTFRYTIKKANAFFEPHSTIVQCHRAYIVNTQKIKTANGNSQGLKLELKGAGVEILVSRSYVDAIRSIL